MSSVFEPESALAPLSSRLMQLMQRVTELIAHGETPPDELLAELELAWREERPADLAGQAMAAALRAFPQAGKLAQGAARLRETERQSAAEVRSAQAAAADPSASFASPPPDIVPHRAASAANRPNVAVASADGWLYTVYFGTNRQVQGNGSQEAHYTAGRGDRVRYGACQVWVPATHKFGELGNSFLTRWSRFEWADDHLVLREVHPLEPEAMWTRLQGAMQAQAGGEPHGLVFLHGFNVSFTAAALSAAQLGFDLKVPGATAFFSWPSAGRLTGYPTDGAAIEASEGAIARFLADFVRRSGAARVHLVAHSMGNRGLLRALQRLAAAAEQDAGVRFGQIFLAAPDVDRDLFCDLARLYPQFSQRTTLYASPGDRAVQASAWLHSGPRAGYLPPVTVAAGVDTVIVPDFDLDLLGHGYISQAEGVLYDMLHLMRGDAPPGARPRLQSRLDHWELRK